MAIIAAALSNAWQAATGWLLAWFRPRVDLSRPPAEPVLALPMPDLPAPSGDFGQPLTIEHLPPTLPIEDLPPLMPAPTPRKPRGRRVVENTGSFWYFDNLLDQLPKCRQLMRKMRTVDPEAYAYNVRMGARVIPDYRQTELSTVPQTFLKKLPSAGMVFVPPGESREPVKKKDRYDGVFTYFQRITRRSCNMVVPPGDVAAIYRCTCVYVRHDKKVATGAEFAVALVDDIPRLISERQVERTEAGFYRQIWGYPRNLEWWHTHGLAKARKEANLFSMALFGDTVQDFAALLFAEAAAQYTASAADNFQVRAARGGVSLGFSVSLGRTPYFFKDRERVVNVDGKTRRIFHHVVKHDRILPDGRTISVRDHYRGLRRFTWMGERIVVTAPEWSPFTINVESLEFQKDESLPKDKDYWTQAEAGQKLRDFIEADDKSRRWTH